MAHLFDSLAVRDIKFANRVFVSPMCQYSGTGGYANDWHFVHLGSRAVGGAGLVLTEATAVLPEGRISPQELGIWMTITSSHWPGSFVSFHEQGSVAGMQLAHAGSKSRPTGHGRVTARFLIPRVDGTKSLLRAPSLLPITIPCPRPRPNKKFKRSSKLSGRRHVVPAKLASGWLRFMPLMVI
jgi:2,4-dienoyl-CoA reductase-like NADH-dependent reductase (Old Yellow Enzyme family)